MGGGFTFRDPEGDVCEVAWAEGLRLAPDRRPRQRPLDDVESVMISKESVLLVPALEIAPMIDEFRLQYAPSARAGIPPHLTVLYPFVDSSRLTEELLTDVDRLLGDSPAFEYMLTEVKEFEEGILYLAPEPAERFIELTAMASTHFGIEPFGGAFPTVIPHLTVTESAAEAERRRIGSVIMRGLPLTARASEAWVMVGSNDSRWTTVHITRFGG